MLHNFIEYADSHGIRGDAGFCSKRIRFLFQFSSQGEYLGLHDYGRNCLEFSNVPHLQFAGDTPKRQFLVDTIDFLTLFPWNVAVFSKAVNKLLTGLSERKTPELSEIDAFAKKMLRFFAEKKYLEACAFGSIEEWEKILKSEEENATKVIRDFLKEGGALHKVFNSNEVKLAHALESLNTETINLFAELEQEVDFEEIRILSTKILTLLSEKQFLVLREQDLKRKWVELLKKQGRGSRLEAIKLFCNKKGPVNMVFNNAEFKRVGKHQYCLNLLKQASSVEPLFGILATTMDDQSVLEQIYNDLSHVTPVANKNNNATFAILNGDESNILVKETSWNGWWKIKEAELSNNISSNDARCFLSGKQIHPLLTHPKIKSLGGVGGNAETSLISFKNGRPAFQSYGFLQGENAAISIGQAAKYAASINHLLNYQHQRLAGAEIIYWYSETIVENENIINAAFSGLGVFEEDDNETDDGKQQEAQAHINAKQFLKSVSSGSRRDLINTRFFALTLQGNKGRAVVQNWMEGRFVDLARNIDQWFSDLEIPRITGKGSAKLPKLETVITCLLNEKKPHQEYADWIKPVTGFREAIWQTAVGGRQVPFPGNTARLALLRLRESMLTDEWKNTVDANGEHMGMRRSRLYARIGIIKAFLIRNLKAEINMEDRTKNKNSVYWLGCLFAVLADLQRSAHQSGGGENVKATIVDRFYTTASTCPKLVHGRLIAQSQHHLRKLENKNKIAANAINNEIASINQKIDFDQVPDMLPLPEQSWFALGYYQQIAEMNRRKAEAYTTKKANLKKGDNK